MNPLVAEQPARKPDLRVIGIGASAGGITGLIELLSAVPKTLPACFVVVLHLSPAHKSFLAEILGRYSKMSVKEAENDDLLRPGVVYIAPPNAHVTVVDNRLRLGLEAPVRQVRPSIDVLFESIADEFKERAIGIILSGAGRDGSDGLRLLKAAGGSTLVQDPHEASFSSMPSHSIDTGCVDYVVPVKEIAARLSSLCLTN
jgi:two-component system chemotaxis response regulator CheB